MPQGRITGAGSDTQRSDFLALPARTATAAGLGGGLAARNIPPGIAPVPE
ncbi:hypothetical protein HFO98_02310 [Rhizobium leguminosarum]|nr:hypothetical protein [Rhizobium leguminosarum]MBY5407320.1 hypothetical protein [Rhizobium leguminosarum]